MAGFLWSIGQSIMVKGKQVFHSQRKEAIRKRVEYSSRSLDSTTYFRRSDVTAPISWHRCRIVADGEYLNTNPQLVDRNFYKMLNHTEVGPVPFSNPPFKFSETPIEVYSPAPCFGEHTEYICREILKMSDEEFVELFQAGVFE